MNQQSSPYPPSDRRATLRHPMLVLRVRLDDGRKAFFGYAKNLSKSGMFIGSVNPREPGEQFEVEMHLPAPLSRTLHCRAEVIWRRDYARSSRLDPGMGMKFLDLATSDARDIDAWIAHCATEGQ